MIEPPPPSAESPLPAPRPSPPEPAVTTPPKDTRPLGIFPAALLFLGASLDWAIPLGGLGLPVATVLMSAALAWLAYATKGKAIPSATWTYAIIVALLATGFTSAAAVSKGTLARELIQFLEIFVLAYAAGAMLKHTRHWLTGAAVSTAVILILNLLQAAGLPITHMSLARAAVLAAALLPFALDKVSSQQHRRNWKLPTAAIPAAGLTILAGIPILLTDGDVALLLPLTTAVVVIAFSGNRPALAGALPAAVILILLTMKIHGPSAPARFHGQFDDTHRTRLSLEAEAALTSPLTAPLGYGPGQYRVAINQLKQNIPDTEHPTDNKVPRDSNSQYLVTLVEAGPLAALALAALFLAGMLIPQRQQTDTPKPSPLPAAIAAFAVGALFATILGRGIGIACGTILGLAMNPPLLSLRPPKISAPPIFLAIASIASIILAFAAPNLGKKIQALAQLTPKAHAAPRIIKPNVDDTTKTSVRLEAENYDNATGGFIRAAANDASGNAVLILPDGSGKATGHAIYEIEIPEAGLWRLTARVYWADGCSNSLGFELGNDTYRISSELFERWHTLRTTKALRLPAGKSSIRVQNIEDGVRLDWFELHKAE